MERKDEKIISLFLNMAEDHGMIKKVDLSDMYQESVGTNISKNADRFTGIVKNFSRGNKKETKVFQMKL